MTRAANIVRYNAPSYYEHAGRLTAAGAVLYGPHFDLDPDSLDALRDPFSVARPFAHAMAQQMGEPFAWGWYETPEGARPAVCVADQAPRFLRIQGATNAIPACGTVGL